MNHLDHVVSIAIGLVTIYLTWRISRRKASKLENRKTIR